MQTSLARLRQPTPLVNIKNVLSAPAPLRVTPVLPSNIMPLSPLYVPALRNTTCPLGHEPIAELIWLEVAPGWSVAQMVVRFGILPGQWIGPTQVFMAGFQSARPFARRSTRGRLQARSTRQSARARAGRSCFSTRERTAG